MDYVETSGNTCKDIGITHGIYAYIYTYIQREREREREREECIGHIQNIQDAYRSAQELSWTYEETYRTCIRTYMSFYRTM